MIFKQGNILNFGFKGNVFMKLIMIGNKIAYGKEAKWTHSAIIGEVGEIPEGPSKGQKGCLVYEALGNGFVKNWYEVWWLIAQIKNGNIILGETVKPLSKVKENCEKYLGRPYSWTDILRISRYILTKGKSINTYDSDKELICSEAVARILYDSSNKKIVLGYSQTKEESEFDKPFDLITPMDLAISKQIKWK